MAALTVGSCLLVGLITSFRLQRVTERHARESLLSLAELLAYTVSSSVDFGLEQPMREALSGAFGIEGITFAQVVDLRGRTFMLVGDPPPTGPTVLPSQGNRFEEVGDVLVVSVPVRDASSHRIGTLLLGTSLDRSHELRHESLRWTLLATLLLAFVSLGVASALGRRLSTPLTQLTDAAHNLADGNFDQPVSIRSNDELEGLADSFNAMTRRLQESRREIERTNQELEAKVRERTEELRQKNLALELQNERALEASRLKSTFLANVSHELRTPLNAILALSELLKDEIAGDLSGEQKMHVEMIHRSGSGLLRLINDILDLSKIEAGRMELRPSACDIAAEMERAAVEMQPLAASKGLDLRVHVEPGLIVVADADRLRQILVNLIGNAVKFTERGRIEVRSSVVEDPPRLILEVQDSGIGIASDLQATIFQEFRQADGSPSRRFGGTGLGLAISRRLAELMEGTLTVESEPAAGSIFRLEVPVGRADEAGPHYRVAKAA